MAGQGRAGAFRRFPVGAMEIVALGDGEQEITTALFADADPTERDRLAREAGFGEAAVPIAVNAFALRADGRVILVDAGSGPARGPGVGHTGAALAAAGIPPEAVDIVLMTHMHGDHAGGLLLASGAPAFPRAALWLADAEAAFWSEPGLADRMPERMRPTILNAQASLAAYADRVRRCRPGEEIVPGARIVDLRGHTPGQIGLRLESRGERLLVWADVTHVEIFQCAHPDWTIGFDIDGAAAAATRRRIFAEVVAEGLPVAGMHLPFPGLGTVERAGEAFRFVPRA